VAQISGAIFQEILGANFGRKFSRNSWHKFWAQIFKKFLAQILGANFQEILGANFARKFSRNSWHKFWAQIFKKFLAQILGVNFQKILGTNFARNPCHERRGGEFHRANWTQKTRFENCRSFSAPLSKNPVLTPLILGWLKAQEKICDRSPCHAWRGEEFNRANWTQKTRA
jgi:hypothetical protein